MASEGEFLSVRAGMTARHWVTGAQTPNIEIVTDEAEITVWPGFVSITTVQRGLEYGGDNQANIGPRAMATLISAWYQLNPGDPPNDTPAKTLTR